MLNLQITDYEREVILLDDQFVRTRILLGDEAMQILKNSRVAVFGVGGVGGYVAEALARSGVGAFDLIDRDQVSVTNLNRQIIATTGTIGMDKTEAMAARIRDINPEARVVQHKCF
jgi:tRNA A37 threonylcarbamoyladenosine dehydratase